MAWLAHCSARIQTLVREGCPCALDPRFNDEEENPERHLDLLEVYSGQGHLNAMVAKAWFWERLFGAAFDVFPEIFPWQAFVTDSFELFDDLNQNILTRGGQLLCVSYAYS